MRPLSRSRSAHAFRRAIWLSSAAIAMPTATGRISRGPIILGHWTPVKRQMFEAVLAARAACTGAIRPGIRAAEIDRAARRGPRLTWYGAAFKHPAGHGAGFGALDHAARPRLHPKSDDVLEPGMVLKLEPGIYVENYGGSAKPTWWRYGKRPDVLTRFQWDLNELVLDIVLKLG